VNETKSQNLSSIDGERYEWIWLLTRAQAASYDDLGRGEGGVNSEVGEKETHPFDL
jgi:hypothetical protein